MEKTIFQCEDSTDGIFTGVYEGWASRLGHEHVGLQVGTDGNYELFSRYIATPADNEKAFKVARTLRERLGEEEYGFIYQASLSKDRDKADAIYRVVVMALSRERKGPISHNLRDPFVCKVFELSRNVGNEAHRYLGFVRFVELKNNILCAVIEPENQILPIITEHFSDRLPGENFMILDKTHGMMAVHEARGHWGLVVGEIPDLEQMGQVSHNELEFQRLWKGFCKSIAIKERTSKRLQQQFLPLKCRTHMTEFSE